MRSSPFLMFAALSVLWQTLPASAQGIVTNGGFEELGPDGFPLDWSSVGTVVTASRDAHAGTYSLQMKRIRRGGIQKGAKRPAHLRAENRSIAKRNPGNLQRNPLFTEIDRKPNRLRSHHGQPSFQECLLAQK